MQYEPISCRSEYRRADDLLCFLDDSGMSETARVTCCESNELDFQPRQEKCCRTALPALARLALPAHGVGVSVSASEGVFVRV